MAANSRSSSSSGGSSSASGGGGFFESLVSGLGRAYTEVNADPKKGVFGLAALMGVTLVIGQTLFRRRRSPKKQKKRNRRTPSEELRLRHIIVVRVRRFGSSLCLSGKPIQMRYPLPCLYVNEFLYRLADRVHERLCDSEHTSCAFSMLSFAERH